MKFFSIVLLGLFFSLQISAQNNVKSSADIETEKELVRIGQELYDAIAIGNKVPWENYVADDVIYTDENWHILTKKDLLDGLSPLPKGYSGSIRMTNVQCRINGDAAVLAYRALEEEYVFGQKLTPIYLVTDTYFKRNGRWQLTASHVIVMPSERKSVLVDPKFYQSLVGTYELSTGVTYRITLEGKKVIGQRSGRAKEELVAADDNTFFRKGTIRGEKVFTRDESGRVIAMLDRRENNDLLWKKIK